MILLLVAGFIMLPFGQGLIVFRLGKLSPVDLIALYLHFIHLYIRFCCIGIYFFPYFTCR